MYNQKCNQCYRSYAPSMYETYERDMLYPESYNDYQMNYNLNGHYENYGNYGDLNFQRNNINQMINQNNENLYPEIYKVVYPMVVKICSNNTRAITKDLVDEMTERIYTNIESEDYLEEEVRQEPELKKGDVRNPNAKIIEKDLKEDRQRRPNTALKSLIKILILRELLGNPSCCMPHPPRPPMPPRPPFGPSNNYPPFMPRNYYNEIYY